MYALQIFAKPGIRIHLLLICILLSMASVTMANVVSTDIISPRMISNGAGPAKNADIDGEAFFGGLMHFVEPMNHGTPSAVSNSSFTVPWSVRGGLLLLPILAFKHFRRKRRDSDS
jgi:hypothetical protein